MIEGDNPPVGILLCTDKGNEMIEYALSGTDNQLFVSTYMLHLLDKKKLKEFTFNEMKEMKLENCGDNINVLTVIASESYKDFIGSLQSDVKNEIYDRPIIVISDYFRNMMLIEKLL